MKFSIVIPCYNRHEELRVALRSCIDQTFEDFEVIVVDDCSEFPLIDLCLSFGDERISCYRNDTNQGVSTSRNIGLGLARGEYVSFLDSDDSYYPHRLEVLNRLLESQNKSADIVIHAQNRVLSPDGAVTIATPQRLPALSERLDEYVLVGGHFLQTNCSAIRTELARSVGFDPRCRLYEDTKFILECWFKSECLIATQTILSVYNDFELETRLSRQRTAERMAPMLAFVRTSCSSKAALGFEAFACGELPFFRKPVYVLTTLFRALRVGVPVKRCAIFLLRSIMGAALVNALINAARIRTKSRLEGL